MHAPTPLQAHDSATAQAEVVAWQEERKESKYAANLVQLPADKKIPMDPKQVRRIGGGLACMAHGGAVPPALTLASKPASFPECHCRAIPYL